MDKPTTGDSPAMVDLKIRYWNLMSYMTWTPFTEQNFQQVREELLAIDKEREALRGEGHG